VGFMERFKIKYLTVAAFILVVGMLGPRSYAATLEGTIFDATGIDGLVVGTVTYNVAFKNGAYSSIYAATPPTFIGDESGAQAAAAALASALSDLQVRYLTGLVQTGAQNALVPSSPLEASGAQCTSQSNCGMNIWSAVASLSFDPSTTYGDADFTVFLATPVPAALPLFATGLAGLGLLGWRRKRKAQAAD
jgi:hypothetical protein